VHATLRYLTFEDDQLLGDLATRLVYSPGDVLVRSGAPLRTLFVLRRGIVRIHAGDTGSDDDVLSRLSAVDLVGEAALLGESKASFTVVADSEVQADVLDVRLIQDVVAVRPGFAARFFRGISHLLHGRLARLV
jgi:CRP-like cAMP-binding protein